MSGLEDTAGSILNKRKKRGSKSPTVLERTMTISREKDTTKAT